MVTGVRVPAYNTARAGNPTGPELRGRLFYAYLYLGLFAEVLGDDKQAREHITKATHEYGGTDYMSDVARVHLILRERKKKSRTNEIYK